MNFLLLLVLIYYMVSYCNSMTVQKIGKYRRQLRAIANKKKSDNTLAVIHVAGHQNFADSSL